MSARVGKVRKQAALVFLTLLLCLVLGLVALGRLIHPLSGHILPLVVGSTLVWALTWLFVHRGLIGYPHERFGGANVVTSARAAMTLLLAACLPGINVLHRGVDVQAFWLLSAIAAVALMLDGLDGKLARSSGLSSSFGARYDMETDALLGLVITLLVWQSGELGIWVLGLGVLRYLFLLAALFLPALQAELYPSFRRKLVCVVQVGVLSVLLTPVVEPVWSTVLAVVALVLLVGSFVRDVLWLMRNANSADSPTPGPDSDNS